MYAQDKLFQCLPLRMTLVNLYYFVLYTYFFAVFLILFSLFSLINVVKNPIYDTKQEMNQQ